METTPQATFQIRHQGSYPTYEEWKLSPAVIFTSGVLVLILPMRNGNFYINFFSLYAFYCSYPTYEEWKLPYIGVYTSNLYKIVLILPMRNGNKFIPEGTKQKNQSSYPTYEEWKQVREYCCPIRGRNSSYPTYEEWKHCTDIRICAKTNKFLSYL